MNRIPTYGAALAATGLLALPAGALADTSLVAGPIKAKGYTLTLMATDGGANDSFSVLANKRSGGSQQGHSWTFDGVSVSIKGSKATLKGSLGRYGKLDAKLRAGRKVRGTVPAGCTGTPGSARRGKLTGTTKLVLDTTFFRTIKPKSLKAVIAKGGKFECGGAEQPQNKGLMLMSSLASGGGQLMVSVVKDGDRVTQQVMQTEDPSATAPASVMHLITVATGASGLSAASDLSTATVPAVGPFLSGTLSFAGEGMGSVATGTVSGDFTAKFDSIGAQSLPAGTDATLMRR